MYVRTRSRSSRRPVEAWAVSIAMLVALVGCSAENTRGSLGGGGNVGAKNDGQEIGSSWPDGEDCRNWGCLEKPGASQSVIAPPSNVTACTSGAECPGGFCVDGVCCDTECSGTCQACTAAKKGSGSDGVCGNIALYGDPDNECANAACDGTGRCQSYNGVVCSQGSDCLSGYCVDGYCCGAGCTETCRACSVAKTGGLYNGQCLAIPSGTDPDNECANSDCNGSGACTMPMNLLNGVACSSAAQCVSGYCVDGVCCGASCTGTCLACTNAKKGSGYDGQCGPIATNTDPDNECANGDCNGSGACNLPMNLLNGVACSSAAQCVSGYCVDGVCCGASCTGTCLACTNAKKGSGYDGQCGPIATNTDPDDECDNATCSGSGWCNAPAKFLNGVACSSAAQCASGYCVDGVCCGAACTETCRACTVAKKGSGFNGQCGPIAAGTDPDNECANGDCNGAAACTTPMLLGNGSACTSNAECMSNFCTDGVCCVQSACTPSDSCHVAMCAAGTGTCTNTPIQCPGGGICTNGACSSQCTGKLGMPGLPLVTGSSQLNSVALGDLNGDGLDDMYATRSGKFVGGLGYLTASDTYLNNGNGGFVLDTAFGESSGSHSPRLWDLNNDGYADPVKGLVSNMVVSLSALRNDTNGGFTSLGGFSFSSSYGIAHIVAADFNGDGHLGLLMAEGGATTLHLSMNNPDGTYSSNITVSNGIFDDIDAADLNGDGFADLALAYTGTSVVGVRFGDGAGAFAAQINYPAGIPLTDVLARDINLDGHIDLITTNKTITSVLINNGNGTFAPAVQYTGGGAVVADFTGNGYPDVWGATPLLNNGDGTFTPKTLPYFPGAGQVGELNGDGLADLVVPHGLGRHILFNVGNATFTPPYDTYNLAGANPYVSVTSADLNADGFDDLVLLNADTASISVLLNNGNGTYAPQIDQALGFNPRVLEVVDMNADGALDLVISTTTSSVRILLNNGNGTFATPVDHSVNTGIKSFIAADLNADGHVDLAVPMVILSPQSSRIRVLFNNGNGTFAPGVDFDVSLWSFIADLTAADLNADGYLDLIAEMQYGEVYTCMNDGNSGFAPCVEIGGGAIGPSECHLLAVDLNGDGYPELASVRTSDDCALSIWWNDGNGNLTNGITGRNEPGAISLTAGDLNGDGFKDLAFATQNNNDQTLYVYLNYGNGSFSRSRYPTSGKFVAATDADGNGIAELVTEAGAKHTPVCLP